MILRREGLAKWQRPLLEARSHCSTTPIHNVTAPAVAARAMRIFIVIFSVAACSGLTQDFAFKDFEVNTSWGQWRLYFTGNLIKNSGGHTVRGLRYRVITEAALKKSSREEYPDGCSIRIKHLLLINARDNTIALEREDITEEFDGEHEQEAAFVFSDTLMFYEKHHLTIDYEFQGSCQIFPAGQLSTDIETDYREGPELSVLRQ